MQTIGSKSTSIARHVHDLNSQLADANHEHVPRTSIGSHGSKVVHDSQPGGEQACGEADAANTVEFTDNYVSYDQSAGRNAVIDTQVLPENPCVAPASPEVAVSKARVLPENRGASPAAPPQDSGKRVLLLVNTMASFDAVTRLAKHGISVQSLQKIGCAFTSLRTLQVAKNLLR